MFKFVGIPVLGGTIHWQDLSGMGDQKTEGLSINFSISGRSTERRALEIVQEVTERNNVTFIRRRNYRTWEIDLDEFKRYFDGEPLRSTEWIRSRIVVEHEFNVIRNEFTDQESLSVLFFFRKNEIEQMIQQKIFLSHKGEDKPLVESVYSLLQLLGFQPWFDKEAMNAGANLERALLAGMQASCAAVFFVTPNYKDEKYLAAEIDYAIHQKREKGERFAITTIVLKDGHGNRGEVPELLRPYVWKEPKNQVEMIEEILKSLPVTTSGVVWR